MVEAGRDLSGTRPAPSCSSRSERLEELRRTLYAPEADPAARVEYEQLLADEALQGEPRRPVPEHSRTRSSARRPGHGVRALVAIGSVLVVLAVAAAGIRLTEPPPPDRLDPPPLAGTTLIGWGNLRDPSLGPRDITYQPSGYDVFQPDGRTVHVALRCVGDGTIVVVASRPFRFDCSGSEATFVRATANPPRGPFMVSAITTGEVVWAARVVLRPAA